jgi:two-component system, sensor histidine kinase ChiS
MSHDNVSRAPESMHSSVGSVLQYVVDNIPYQIFWKDKNSVYLGCNKNFAALDGKSDPRELVGRSDFDMAWKAHAHLYRAGDVETMTRGEAILDKEERSIDPAGNETIILTSKVPLRNRAGEVTGLLGIIVDITARKRLELELQRAKEDADRAAQAKSDFIANVTHELRTPLTLILGPLGRVLADPALGEASRLSLESVRRNGFRLYNLVNDVLDFSRAQAERLIAHPEPLELVRVVQDLVLDVQPQAELGQLGLDVDTAFERLDVLLDPKLLERMLLNLIGNAIKFTPAGGRVRVSIATRENALRLAVKDSGIGIPKAALGTLFEKFGRVDNSTTRRQEGTGLGLALVQLCARAHGGSVEVESEEGKGSEFSLILPLERTQPAAAVAPAGSSAAALGTRAWQVQIGSRQPGPPRPARVLQGAEGRPWVLVAEDNDDLRQFTMEVLASDFSVVGVENGALAWQELGKRRFDVVVSDLMMPELDGLGLTAKIKAHHALRTLPVILVTARGGEGTAQVGLDAGADDYVSKPFSPEELLARVRAAQRMKTLQEELRQRSHAAGAESVASGILHNVGNVLNSVSVSADVLVRKGEASVLSSLERLCALWAEECKDEAATVRFLTGDERGRRFGGALQRMVLDLRQEHDERSGEARSIVLSVGHASAIIASELRGEQGGAVAEAVDLSQLLAQAQKLSGKGAAGAEVRVELKLGELPVLYTDPHALLSVLVNLLTNAHEAIARQPLRAGRIAIEASHDDQRLTLRIRDDGAGIRAEDLPRVFQQGFTTRTGGHGLGLHMSAILLQRLDGAIAVASDGPGKGAAFTLTLPLERMPQSRGLRVAVG